MVLSSEQLSKHMDEVPLASMGCDAADYNNDGFVDLLTLDMLPEGNEGQKMHMEQKTMINFNTSLTRDFITSTAVICCKRIMVTERSARLGN